MAVPKAIVITAWPRNIKAEDSGMFNGNAMQPFGLNAHSRAASILLAPSPSSSSDGGEDDQCTQISPAPVRKRQKLDHLSIEEKVLRRKLKNRVAAQSARDRKKARMTELEEHVQKLHKEKMRLMAENVMLSKKNLELQKENCDLRLKMGLSNIKREKDEVSVNKSAGSCTTLEHASLFNGPLQKEQVPQLPTLLKMHLVCWQMIASLMTFLTCCNTTVKSFSVETLPELNLRQELAVRAPPLMKWWGPQQRNWNPSKN